MSPTRAAFGRHPVLTYYVLTFAISYGGILLVIGGPRNIPGSQEQMAALQPLAVLALFAGPFISGLLCTGLFGGRAGYRDLLSRLARWRVDARWYVVALLTAPLLLGAVPLALSLLQPGFLPAILTTSDKPGLLAFGIGWGLIGGGLLEETGWTGFAIPRLRLHHGILATALVVGVLWGAWHVLLIFWMSGSAVGEVPLALFLTVRGVDLLVGQLPAYRVLLVWVYDRTSGSLLVTMLMHASLSASTFILGPTSVSGVPFLAYCLVSSAAIWLVVTVGAAAIRRQPSRRPLLRQVA